MPKITPRVKETTVTVKTKTKPKERPGDWWNSSSKDEMSNRMLATAVFLKTQNQYRYRQASMYAQLYGNMPIFGGAGTNLTRINTKNIAPSNRPTMSIITSIADTIVSRFALGRPRPFFLTDNGDYKQRTLAKEMNSFISGEFFQTKYYQHRELMIRDACVWGTGVLKVLEDQNKRVALERRLATQLCVDASEAFLSYPRQLYEFQLVDRSVLAEMFPKYGSTVERAENAFPDQSGDSGQSISDQVLVVEAWRLASGPKRGDGMHVISCSGGCLQEKEFDKEKFPFLFQHYSPPQVGFWGQGVAERQLGNQAAINQLLMTIHQSINLVGVPRIFLEDGSKVVKAQINNQVGAIVTYRGAPPIFNTAECNSPELYQEVQNVINRAYQEEGVSQLAASSVKPVGLNSGAALREYDDVQQDRLATLSKRDEAVAVEAAYLIIDKARDIAERDGKYQTVYPDKTGAKQIDLPASKLLDDPFVIQCFDVSSLPRDPSGRLEKVTEMMQAGLVTPQEGRRLLGYPDIEQDDKLANAAEERILRQLDDIIEKGEYSPPDPFTDLILAETKVAQYYNLYSMANLEEDRCQMLRDYSSQIMDLKNTAQAAMAPVVPPPGGSTPQALPAPEPVNPMIPNVPGSGAA